MTTTEPNPEMSRAVRALMDASPEFRVAMENAAKGLAKFADALNDFQIEPTAAKLAKVAEAQRAARRKS